jgi:hypothetical protein
MAKAKVSHPQKSDQPLGTLIAAVLNHPDTPQPLYDAMVNELSSLQTNKIVDTPEFIQTVLDLNQKYGDPEQEGGAQ